MAAPESTFAEKPTEIVHIVKFISIYCSLFLQLKLSVGALQRQKPRAGTPPPPPYAQWQGKTPFEQEETLSRTQLRRWNLPAESQLGKGGEGEEDRENKKTERRAGESHKTAKKDWTH